MIVNVDTTSFSEEIGVTRACNLAGVQLNVPQSCTVGELKQYVSNFTGVSTGAYHLISLKMEDIIKIRMCCCKDDPDHILSEDRRVENIFPTHTILLKCRKTVDEHTLDDCNIGEEVHLVMRWLNCAPGPKVVVPLPDGGKYEYQISCPRTIFGLKGDMQEKTGIMTNKIKLFYNDEELENEDFTSYYISSDLPEVKLRLELSDAGRSQ